MEGVGGRRAHGADEVTAMVLTAPRTFERRQVPRPAIGDDEALLRVEACGLCGTDHEQYTGLLFGGRPFVPGHETIGVVEELGPGAARSWGVAEGDRVAVEVFRSCGDCGPCRSGAYRRCIEHGLGDMYGFVPFGVGAGLWGGYATHQVLGSGSQLLRVPDALSAVDATLFNPVGAGIRWAATVPETKPGDVVVVLGPGIRGLAAAAAASDAGAAYVMVTGLGPRDRSRLDLAARFGADRAVDVAVDDPVRTLVADTGSLADVVVDVTAKAPAALGQAVALARPGGTVVLAGTRGSDDTPGLRPDDIVYKELRLLGALGVDVVAYRAAFDLLASGRYPFTELPRRVVGFDGIDDLLRTMAGESGDDPPVHGVLVPGT